MALMISLSTLLVIGGGLPFCEEENIEYIT